MAARAEAVQAPLEPARPRGGSAARTAAGQRRVAGGILWIGVVALLLAGIVGLNVASLRLHLRLDQVSAQRAELRAANAALASRVSHATAAGRIRARARERFGLVPVEPTYVELGR